MNIYRRISDRKQLEFEYSPSSLVPNFGSIVKSYATASANTRMTVGPPQVIRYGPNPPELMDYFPAPSTQRFGVARPALIYYHGGYWQELSKNEHSFPAKQLGAADIGFVAVNYGLAPEASLGVIVSRARRALDWIQTHAASLGVDPNALHLAGSSAGAHLAAMTAMSPPEEADSVATKRAVKSLILMSGVFDLRPIPLTYINDKLRMDSLDSLRFSPLLLVDAHMTSLPPALIAYGENESREFKRQSAAFSAALTRKGVRCVLQEIANRNHFDLIFDLAHPKSDFGDLSLKFLSGN